MARIPLGKQKISAADAVPADAAVRRQTVSNGWLHRTFESLENRDFRMLWIGMLLSMGGFQMQMIARGILAFDLTQDARITAIVSMGFAPTMLVVSLFGGVLGDRMERRTLIQISQAANALLTALIAALIIMGVVHWAHLFGVSLVQGAMFALQMPARQAAIPQLVGKERVSNAIALNATAMGLMNLLAPGVGGFIYGVAGPDTVYMIVSAMLVLAVVFTGLMPRLYPVTVGPRRSVLRNISAGFGYVRQNALVRALLIQSVVVALLSMPFRMLIPVYAEEVYGAGEFGVGMLTAAAGLGGLLGSLGIANLRKGQHRGLVVLIAAVLSGMSLLLASASTAYLVGLVALVGVGIGESGRWALGQALIMEETDDEYRSRVMSLMMMTFGLMPLALYPLGDAYERFGAQESVLVVSVMLLVASVMFIIGSPRLRRLA